MTGPPRRLELPARVGGQASGRWASQRAGRVLGRRRAAPSALSDSSQAPYNEAKVRACAVQFLSAKRWRVASPWLSSS